MKLPSPVGHPRLDPDLRPRERIREWFPAWGCAFVVDPLSGDLAQRHEHVVLVAFELAESPVGHHVGVRLCFPVTDWPVAPPHLPVRLDPFFVELLWRVAAIRPALLLDHREELILERLLAVLPGFGDDRGLRGDCSQPGTLVALSEVWLTRANYGPIMLICCGAKGGKEPLYVVTKMNAAEAACRLYAKRFRIETFFSDQKSRGFHLHKSHLSDPQRLSRLFIAAC